MTCPTIPFLIASSLCFALDYSLSQGALSREHLLIFSVSQILRLPLWSRQSTSFAPWSPLLCFHNLFSSFRGATSAFPTFSSTFFLAPSSFWRAFCAQYLGNRTLFVVWSAYFRHYYSFFLLTLLCLWSRRGLSWPCYIWPFIPWPMSDASWAKLE